MLFRVRVTKMTSGKLPLDLPGRIRAKTWPARYLPNTD
jgi:hypothetical protein